MRVGHAISPFYFGHDNADLLGIMSGMVWAAGSVVIRRFPNAHFLHITFMERLVRGALAGGAALLMGHAISALKHVVAILGTRVFVGLTETST